MGWETISIILGTVLGISGIIGLFWANTKNTLIKQQAENYEKTIQSYKEVVESQDIKLKAVTEDLKELRGMHTDNVKMIGQLQGELQTWKQLPIKELANNMAYITEVQYIMAKHMGIDHLPELKLKTKSKDVI